MAAQEARNLFSRTLFVNDNGSALQFFIRPCAEKCKLRKLIEERGGVLAAKLEENVFRLVLPNDPPPKQSTGCLRVQFIYDCVSKNLLLSTDKYSIVTRTNSELDDDLDIENNNEDNFIYCVKTMAKDTKCRREYTTEDDKKVITYLVKQNGYADVKGRAIWKKMEDHFGSDRTWQSLKERYLKRIVPNLQNYNLPDEVYKKIKVGCGAWTKQDECRFETRKRKAKKRRIIYDESSEDSGATVEFNKNTAITAQGAKKAASGAQNIEPGTVLMHNETSSENTREAHEKSAECKVIRTNNSEIVNPKAASSKSNFRITSPKDAFFGNCKSTSGHEPSTSDKSSILNYYSRSPQKSAQVSEKLKSSDMLSPSSINESNICNTEDQPNLSTTCQPHSVEVSDVQAISVRENSNFLRSHGLTSTKTTTGKPLQFFKLQKSLVKKLSPQKPEMLSSSNPITSIQQLKVYSGCKTSNSAGASKKATDQECDVRKTLANDPQLAGVSNSDVQNKYVSVAECQEVDNSQKTDCSVSLLDGDFSLFSDKHVESEPTVQSVAIQTEGELNSKEKVEEEVNDDEDDDDDLDSLDVQLLKTVNKNMKPNIKSQNFANRKHNVKALSQHLDATSWNGEESLTALPFLDTLSPDDEANELNTDTGCTSRTSEDKTIDYLLSIENSLKALQAKAIKGRKLVLLNDSDIVLSKSEFQKISSDVKAAQESFNNRLLNVQVETIMRKPLSVLSKQDDVVLESYLINNEKFGDT